MLPTAVLLAVLNELGKLLRLSGPSNIVWSIEVERRITFLAYRDLNTEDIMSFSFNKSSSNGTAGF